MYIVSYIIFCEQFLCNLLKFPEQIVHHKFTAGTWRVPLLLKIDESTNMQSPTHAHTHIHAHAGIHTHSHTQGECVHRLSGSREVERLCVVNYCRRCEFIKRKWKSSTKAMLKVFTAAARARATDSTTPRTMEATAVAGRNASSTLPATRYSL